MKLAAMFDRDELNNLNTPVIVEGWDKVKGSGSKRRRYLAEFDEKERRALSALYPVFYRWYLVTGVPEQKFPLKILTVEPASEVPVIFTAVADDGEAAIEQRR